MPAENPDAQLKRSWDPAHFPEESNGGGLFWQGNGCDLGQNSLIYQKEITQLTSYDCEAGCLHTVSAT